MTPLQHFFPEVRFGGFTSLDGTFAFYTRVAALSGPNAIILDVGCGRGAYREDGVASRRQARDLRRIAARVIGLDVDPGAAINPFLHEFRPIANEVWPVANASVDLCVADWVLEHIEKPALFFSECARVLKSGGIFCARTTNRKHYAALAARLIPSRLHRRALRTAQPGRKSEDVFPAWYRCNTRRVLWRQLREQGFDAVVCGYESEPAYLDFSTVAYALGVLYQRLAPQGLRGSLFVFARKSV